MLLCIVVIILMYVTSNNEIWVDTYIDEPTKRKILTLGRAVGTIGLFILLYFIFRMFNRSLLVTDNEIIESRILGGSKIIPIDEIVTIKITHTEDITKKMYYSPKGRSRYNLLTKLNSVLFTENSTVLWNDMDYDSCSHLTNEEKKQIRYQKEYEQHYIQYEESIQELNNRKTITFSGDIPNKLMQAKYIANEIKNIKDKYKQANEQNSELNANYDVRETLLTTQTVRPVIDMKFPYFINDIDTLEVTIVTTGEFNSISFAFEEFHNPIALYSAIHSLASTENRNILDMSDIENKINYIPSSYRGDIEHD